MIGIYSCTVLTTAGLCALGHARHARTYRRCVFVKCFPSLHFTDNVVDLVSSVAIGLTFKDFLTTFPLFCHVLSTNRSCQTKGSKSKPEHMSAWNRVSHRPSRMQTYIWLDVHYGNFFLPSWKLAVIVNLLPVLLFYQRKNDAGLARKVALSKFSWVFWSCESLLIVCSRGAVTARNPWIPVFLSP